MYSVATLSAVRGLFLAWSDRKMHRCANEVSADDLVFPAFYCQMLRLEWSFCLHNRLLVIIVFFLVCVCVFVFDSVYVCLYECFCVYMSACIWGVCLAVCQMCVFCYSLLANDSCRLVDFWHYMPITGFCLMGGSSVVDVFNLWVLNVTQSQLWQPEMTMLPQLKPWVLLRPPPNIFMVKGCVEFFMAALCCTVKLVMFHCYHGELCTYPFVTSGRLWAQDWQAVCWRINFYR